MNMKTVRATEPESMAALAGTCQTKLTSIKDITEQRHYNLQKQNVLGSTALERKLTSTELGKLHNITKVVIRPKMTPFPTYCKALTVLLGETREEHQLAQDRIYTGNETFLAAVMEVSNTLEAHFNHVLHYLLTQYSCQKSMKIFGERVKKAALKELKQLHNLDTIQPVKATELSISQKKAALESIMTIKEKYTREI